eukprot:TRINITY_DN1840_c0_g2_i1.p1 TRINITY_DN1840_c0_g2~~TRINITY_DN1840_c0_g2_i1.p1  ORF type:complete len:312 (-),score=48.10 TRINITY_DN1840_c0_g2_i1:668-1603(-)
MAFWDGYLTDEQMATIAPIIIYWLYSGFYVILDGMNIKGLACYRLHSRRDEETKNLVSKKQVVKGVLLQQVIQVSVAIVLYSVAAHSETSKKREDETWLSLAMQFAIATLVMDSWQYLIHRSMHEIRFLYRHVHSWHHRLVVPYAYGALYNHPLEALLLDTVGGVLSFLASGMSARMSVYFFSFATMKTVDDHCGLRFPLNPLQLLFANNSAYHDIHHQLYGLKWNYSQPFFITWDWILGTYMPYELQKRPEGGLEARPLRSKRVSSRTSDETAAFVNGKVSDATTAIVNGKDHATNGIITIPAVKGLKDE